ncbi:hypothetical protein DFJ73DRAFT_965906, partial [Zopfochytrium polystomum]
MCGPRYQFCILCGTALETALSGSQFHTAARAHLLDARWTRPGRDESSGCLYPLCVPDPEDPLEAGEVPDFDPDAATDCWFAMAADPSPPTVDARASTFYSDDEVEDGLAFGFPFHAGCAKWICCALAQRGVSLEQLVAYLGETVADQEGSFKWMGDLEECCPDGASIQEIQNEFYGALFGWQAYCFARPDTIWWQKDYGIDPYFPDLPLWNEVAAKTKNLGADDVFEISSDGFKFRLRRGTYEGGIVIVPIPSVAVPTDGTTAQLPSTPAPPSGEFPHLASPQNLPTLVLSKILDWLTAPTRTSKTHNDDDGEDGGEGDAEHAEGDDDDDEAAKVAKWMRNRTSFADGRSALPLLSTNRAWYHHGRATAWRTISKRDGFARVPGFARVRGSRVRDAVRDYDERDVDWKRAYFCYESRNARRITRNA